jgi:hypothetical protein
MLHQICTILYIDAMLAGKDFNTYLFLANSSHLVTYLFMILILYIRKVLVVKDRYIDEGFLVLTMLGMAMGNIPCYLDNLDICWTYGSISYGMSMMVMSLYFDFYFVIKCIIMNRGHIKSTRQYLQFFIPCVLTACPALFYLFGTLMYTYDLGNYFTNTIWNYSALYVSIIITQV